MKIPQCNPFANYQNHKKAIDQAVDKVLSSGWYVLGNEVESFQKHFAKFNESAFCVGVGNGTDAITLGLISLGIKPGDLVITVSHTAVPTVSAIMKTGATPVLIDIDPTTYHMDLNQLEEVIKSDKKHEIKAVVLVHLYGRAADAQQVLKICRANGIQLVEDCAQAHGAVVNNQTVGSIGDIGTFSFYPTKNLGALGDGGAIITSNTEIHEQLLLLRQYGWKERNLSLIDGYNSRLDELQAAILNVKLGSLKDENAKRASIASYYNDHIDHPEIILPDQSATGTHVFHQYVIRHPKRDLVRDNLTNHGIGTLIHYPVPIHLQPAYQGQCKMPCSLAQTEEICNQIVSLPMFPEMEQWMMEKVSNCLNGLER